MAHALQALDPRTRLVLFKLLNRKVFTAIDGCISTGKEANVYHASAPDGSSLAIKIYKTSILVFKDRERCAPDPGPIPVPCPESPAPLL